MATTSLGQTSDPPLRVSGEGAIRRLELYRPEVRNPLDSAMVAALGDAVARACDDPNVRVILVTGAGPAFSAGGNLGNIHERLAAEPEADGRDPIATGNRAYGRFLEAFVAVPKVTIVAVAGAAMGGGAGLVCAADLAIASSAAKFGFPETSIGLVPAQILPFVAARIGPQNARRLMLTGERIDAAEAHRIGLVDYLVEDPSEWEARVEAVCASAVKGGPGAMAATKRMLREGLDMEGWYRQGLTRYLDAAAEVFARQMRSEALEGVSAMREKRQPAWARGRTGE